MAISRLVIGNFRNIKEAELRPADSLNFIYGENGSGKTSVLECLYMLAVGRSFRTRQYTHLIQYEHNQLSLFAEITARAQHKIGILRNRHGKDQFKLDDAPLTSAAELARLIPVQLLNSESFQLLEGGPARRRRFLDWLMFHVKPEFGETWMRFARVVKQRNTLLRRDNITPADLAPWDRELARLGESIDGYRQEGIRIFVPFCESYLSELEYTKGDFNIEYVAGWDVNQSLVDQLSACFAKDKKYGYTTVGPHRADLKTKLKQRPVESVLSRGQQKALVTALLIAQIRTVNEFNPGKKCVFLIDDLPSEFDETHREMVCEWLSQRDLQIFVTGIDLQVLLRGWPDALKESSKLFHVKHGVIAEQNL